MREYYAAYKVNHGEKDVLNLNQGVYQVIKNNFGCWAADPFIIEDGGEVYVFAEVWEHIKGKGAIGYTKYNKEKKKFGKWKIVIDEPYHLSYPNIYKEKEQFWMCPESGNAQEIAFYRAVKFPDEWTKEVVISKKGKYVDTTYFKIGEVKYGMTFEINKNREELKIFQIVNNSLQFIKQNNIIPNVALARPGGKIICRDGLKYRIGQIGTPHYGSGLVVAQFDFEQDNYREIIKKKYYPSDFSIEGLRSNIITGIHTYNQSEKYEIIDVQTETKSIVTSILRTLRRFKKKLLMTYVYKRG